MTYTGFSFTFAFEFQVAHLVGDIIYPSDAGTSTMTTTTGITSNRITIAMIGTSLGVDWRCGGLRKWNTGGWPSSTDKAFSPFSCSWSLGIALASKLQFVVRVVASM